MKNLERPSNKNKTGKPEFVEPERKPSSFAGTFKRGGKIRNMFTEQYD